MSQIEFNPLPIRQRVPQVPNLELVDMSGVLQEITEPQMAQHTELSDVTGLASEISGETLYNPVESVHVSVPVRSAGRRMTEQTSDDIEQIYHNEIGKHPLLRAEEEVDLAMRIEAGLFAGKLLDGVTEVQGFGDEEPKDVSKLVPGQDDIELIADYEELVRQGEAAKQTMLESNLRLSAKKANHRIPGRENMSFLDLAQAGNIGLIRAVEKFDYKKGFKFSTYATWWIRQSINEAIAEDDLTVTIPKRHVEKLSSAYTKIGGLRTELGREPTDDEIAAIIEITPQKYKEIKEGKKSIVPFQTQLAEDLEVIDTIADENQIDPLAVPESVLIDKMLEDLSAEQVRILKVRYGLEDGEPKTIVEAGEILGLSRGQVGSRQKKAEEALRRRVQAGEFEDYL